MTVQGPWLHAEWPKRAKEGLSLFEGVFLQTQFFRFRHPGNFDFLLNELRQVFFCLCFLFRVVCGQKAACASEDELCCLLSVFFRYLSFGFLRLAKNERGPVRGEFDWLGLVWESLKASSIAAGERLDLRMLEGVRRWSFGGSGGAAVCGYEKCDRVEMFRAEVEGAHKDVQ